MSKWKSTRKVKSTNLLGGIMKRMVNRNGADRFEVPLGLTGVLQKGTGRPGTIVTFLMESPEVEENMLGVIKYHMTRNEAEAIIRGGNETAVEWLKPRAMDLVSIMVLAGDIDMPSLLGLHTYDDITLLDLESKQEPHGKAFMEVFSRMAAEVAAMRMPAGDA